MKIGPIEFNWNPRRTTLEDTIAKHLREDAGPAVIVAKMARSEVKNYLAELAEQAGIPFTDSATFVRGLDHLNWLITGKPLDPDPPPTHCQRPNCVDIDHPICNIACDGTPS